MNNNEIMKANTESLMTNVRDRIRGVYVQLIPDEMWDKLVQNEIDDFFAIKSNNSYNSPVRQSQFKTIVVDVLKDRIKDIFKDHIKENFESHDYDNSLMRANDRVKDIISQNSDKILSDVCSSMLQMSLTSNF